MSSLPEALRQIGRGFGAGIRPCVGLSVRPDCLVIASPAFKKQSLSFSHLSRQPIDYAAPLERGGIGQMVKQLLPLTREIRGVDKDVALVLPTSLLSLCGVTSEYVDPKELAESQQENVAEFYADLDETVEIPAGVRLSDQIIDNNKKLDEFTARLAWVDPKAADAYVRMVREAGLNPVVVDVEILAVANFWAVQQDSEPFLRPVAFLEIGPGGAYVLVVRRDTWLLRPVSVHPSDLVLLNQAAGMAERPKGEFWDEVFGRIAESAEAAFAEVKEWPGQSTVSEIVMYGHGVDVSGLASYMRDERDLPAYPLELDDRYKLDETGQKAMRDVTSWGDIAAAVGAGLRVMNPYGAKQALDFQCNFFGDFAEVADSRVVTGFARGTRNFMLILLVAWLGYAGAFLMPAALGGGVGQALNSLQDSISQQQLLSGGAVKQVKQAEAELSALGDGPSGDGSRLARFWNGLPEWTPAGTRLLRAAYQAPGSEEGALGRFQIEAISLDEGAVQRFRDSLRASGMLQESGEPSITNDVGGLRVTLLLELLQ